MTRWELLTEDEWEQLVGEATTLCDQLVEMSYRYLDKWDKWSRVTDQAFARLSRRASSLAAMRKAAVQS